MKQFGPTFGDAGKVGVRGNSIGANMALDACVTEKTPRGVEKEEALEHLVFTKCDCISGFPCSSTPSSTSSTRP